MLHRGDVAVGSDHSESERERESKQCVFFYKNKAKAPTGLYILVGSAITIIQQLKKAFYGIKGHFSHNEIKLLKMG